MNQIFNKKIKKQNQLTHNKKSISTECHHQFLITIEFFYFALVWVFFDFITDFYGVHFYVISMSFNINTII